jgi:hypothetical protein
MIAKKRTAMETATNIIDYIVLRWVKQGKMENIYYFERKSRILTAERTEDAEEEGKRKKCSFLFLFSALSAVFSSVFIMEILIFSDTWCILVVN